MNRLTELNLLVRDEKIESRKNKKLVTDIIDITRNGVIIALTLEIEKHDKNSEHYGKILKFLLNEWKSFVPPGYRDPQNIGYYLIEEILDECLKVKKDILLDFINLIREHSNGYDINFSILRYELNCLIFKTICSDNQFRIIFYKTLNNFDMFKDLKGVNQVNEKLEEIRKEHVQLMKYQFKLDVESFIDKCFSEYLKIESYNVKSYAWGLKPGHQNKTHGEVHRNRQYGREIMNEIVLTFEIRNEWEKLRNKNLIYYDRISLLVKCYSCGQIYSYGFNLESDSLSTIPCKHCNKLTVSQYVFENELNAQYLKRISSIASKL